MSAVYSLVVTSGPRLGDIESGVVAGLTTPAFSIVSGGLACIAGVGAVVLAFPALAAFEGEARPGAPPAGHGSPAEPAPGTLGEAQPHY